MWLISFVLLWWIGVGFTMGLVSEEDTPNTGFVLIGLAWPIVLGEYLKQYLKGTTKCS